jgi:uncharacterized protein (DUF302 family)
MTKSSYVANHVRVTTAKSFAEVTGAFERQLGKFDPAALQASSSDPDPAAKTRSRLEAMAGPSGFMLFATLDHGSLLTLFGPPRRAMHYVIGNPLFALQMTRRKLGAGLYAPLRVLIYEEGEETVLEYDSPSSVFGQFDDPEVAAVASMLDAKLAALVAASV